MRTPEINGKIYEIKKGYENCEECAFFGGVCPDPFFEFNCLGGLIAVEITNTK